MKKKHLFWIIPVSLLVLVLLGWGISFVTAPVKFRKICYWNNTKSKTSVTEKELKSDLNLMKYYFQYAYSGYDFAVEKGFDIDEAISEITQLCVNEKDTKDNKIPSGIVGQKIYEVLSKKLTLEDNHLSIGGPYFSTSKSTLGVYFTDVYLEENGNDFVVYKSDVEAVKPGMKFTGSELNLFEWFDGNKKSWRFGIQTKKNIKNLIFNCGENKIPVPIAKDENLNNKSNWVNVQTTKDTVYISISDFSLLSFSNNTKGFSDKFLNEFYEKIHAALMDGKKNVILDLRNNGGGDCLIASRLVSHIFYYKTPDREKMEKLLNLNSMKGEYRVMSPVAAQIYANWFMSDLKEERKIKKQRKENPDMEFYDIQKSEIDIYNSKLYKKIILKNFIRPECYKDYSSISYEMGDEEFFDPDFKGNFYVLMNKNSGSAAEYTIAQISLLCRQYDLNLNLIGENSNGAVSYFNPRVLFLPNSSTAFYMPTAYNPADIFYEDFRYKGESKGWQPDYWSNNKNLLNTLLNITSDVELEELLKGLEKYLL